MVLVLQNGKIMKTITLLTKGIATAGLMMVIGLTGCEKDAKETTLSREETDNLTMVSEEDATTDMIFSDIHEQELGMLEEIGTPGIGLNNESVGLDTVGRCLKVSITPRDIGVWPKTVIFDYGTGCTGPDEKTRKGKMITVYSSPIIIPGATAVTTFDGFFVNGIKVQGKHTTKNNSTASVLIFTRTVQEGKLTFPNNGGVAIWNATHTNKQIAGLGTPGFPLDDEFQISGEAKGVFEGGGKRLEWSRVIREPLHKTFKCRWIDKGVVQITRNDNKATLNYGAGTCDNKAVITINGVSKEITL